MLIKRLLLLIYDRLVYLKRDIYDYLTRKEVLVSIGDLMQDRSVSDGTLLLVASRLLDVEAYVNNHDETFFWQKTLSDIKDYNDEEWCTLFKNIIMSYQEKGYNGKSHFLLDCNGRLRNGTHRMALHLFCNIYIAKAYAVNRTFPFFDVMYKRFSQDLQPSCFTVLERKLEIIHRQLIEDGVSFCAVIPKENSLEMSVASISTSIQINKEIELCMLPRGVSDFFYLNEKSEYKAVLFTLEEPQYEVTSGLLESKKIKIASIPEGSFVSKSCYEGKIVYDQLTPYFKTDNVNSK